jgi:hypothetical protein
VLAVRGTTMILIDDGIATGPDRASGGVRF